MPSILLVSSHHSPQEVSIQICRKYFNSFNALPNDKAAGELRDFIDWKIQDLFLFFPESSSHLFDLCLILFWSICNVYSIQDLQYMDISDMLLLRIVGAVFS